MRKFRSAITFGTAIAGALALFAQNAGAVSVGNGGSQPVGIYSSPLPSLAPGAVAQPQLNHNGQLVVAPATAFPVSPATTFPISVASAIPITAATTLPVSGSLTVTFPSSQPVQPAPSSSPFAVIPYPSSSPFPISGTVSVSPSSFPSTQFVAPAPSASPFSFNCVSGCSGGGSGSSGVYNSTLPTYTSGSTVVPQYDVNGRAIVAPFTISLPSPLPMAGQYNAVPGAYSSGGSPPLQTDPQGYLYLSPFTAVQTGGGQYTAVPIPLQDGQIVPQRTDQFGNTVVTASSPLPFTLVQQQTITDRSGKILAASTAQEIMPPNPNRNGLIFQSNCSGVIWLDVIGILASGAGPDFAVAANTTWQSPPFMSPKSRITVWSTTTSSCNFTAEEY